MGRRFTSDQELKETAHAWLAAQPKSFFPPEDIKKFVQQWNRCIEKQWDWVEKWCYYEFSTFIKIKFVSVVRIIMDWPTYIYFIYFYIISTKSIIVFKLSPCCREGRFSSGYFPGIWIWKAEVSEHYNGSIFAGWWLWMITTTYLWRWNG
jgi:hypothetical protein